MSSEKVVFLQRIGCLLSRQVSASYYQEELQQYKGEFDHLVLLVNIGGYVSNTPTPWLPLSHHTAVSNYCIEQEAYNYMADCTLPDIVKS